MKTILLGIITAICLFTTLPASAQNGRGAGTCLVVNNKTTDTVSITIKVPAIYNVYHWEIPADIQELLVIVEHVPIKSTNEKNSQGGNWGFDYTGDGSPSWIYDASRNTDLGCDGSWVVTLQ